MKNGLKNKFVEFLNWIRFLIVYVTPPGCSIMGLLKVYNLTVSNLFLRTTVLYQIEIEFLLETKHCTAQGARLSTVILRCQ